MQESMCSQMKCLPTPAYREGQQVWLLTKSWKPQVLKVQWVGPFEVQEVLHNACRLHLPLTLHVHPVINVAYLKPVISTVPLDPSHLVLSNPHYMADHEWDVQEIVAHKC